MSATCKLLLLLLHAFPAKEARCVLQLDKLQVKVAKFLPLIGLARSKQEPINREHGAQYLYRNMQAVHAGKAHSSDTDNGLLQEPTTSHSCSCAAADPPIAILVAAATALHHRHMAGSPRAGTEPPSPHRRATGDAESSPSLLVAAAASHLQWQWLVTEPPSAILAGTASPSSPEKEKRDSSLYFSDLTRRQKWTWFLLYVSARSSLRLGILSMVQDYLCLQQCPSARNLVGTNAPRGSGFIRPTVQGAQNTTNESLLSYHWYTARRPPYCTRPSRWTCQVTHV
jgi:hypothetical protein